MKPNLNPNIFLSYAWANAVVADEIDNDFKNIGIQFRRDIRDAHYRSSIKEFMHLVGESDFVLMIISDEYLRSENCMYEVTELLNTHEFEKRILPIVIENATSIFKALNQKIYYDYWQDEKKKADKLKKQHANEVSIEYSKKCQDIQNNLPRFFQKIMDLNVSTYKKLRDENYRSLLTITGFSEDALMEETLRIRKIDDIEERELELEEFLKKHPDNKYGIFQNAEVARIAKKNKKAKKYYEDALKIDWKYGFAHNNLGLLLQDHFLDYENAKLHYEEALEIDSRNAAAHHNLARLMEEVYSEFNIAKHHYEQAIKVDSKNSYSHNNLAGLFEEHFSDAANAKFHYEAAIKADPQNEKAYYNLANLFENHFVNFRRAKQLYEHALKINPKYQLAIDGLNNLIKNHFK